MAESMFNALTDQEKGMLIAATLQYQDSLAAIFGEEMANESFEKIQDIVMPELKYEMLKNTLTNKYTLHVMIQGITGTRQNHNTGSWGYEKVSAIKAIRTYSANRMGLKEAKDICDAAEHGIPTKIQVESAQHRLQFINELQSYGVKVV